jgi:glyoxylase-like metal-dependent hydrolase (beta-lactamase superfamily II)
LFPFVERTNNTTDMKVHTIDLKFQGVPGVIAAYLVESAGEVALIETGPGSTLETLCSGILEAGVAMAAVNKVFVTHVHLDHAGAAGWWARQGAHVFCHPRARRHLVEPAKLIDSARHVYGAAFDTLWGEMVAAPTERVIALQDGESVTLGEQEVVAHETPGHARHHHAFSIGSLCFTGDVAGVRLAGSNYQSVAAAPPQFELEAYLQSVRKLSVQRFKKLYLTHFGEVDDAEAHFKRYEDRLSEVAAQASDSVLAGQPDEVWRACFEECEQQRAREAGCSAETWQHYQLANGAAMCADGLRLWAGDV